MRGMPGSGNRVFVAAAKSSRHVHNLLNHMDSISPEKRKWVMSQVKGKNTTPEKTVRSLLHRLGCFWHRHNCPNGQRLPKTNVDFWKNKLDNNAARDLRNLSELRALGWKILVIWECEVKDSCRLQNIILSFLRPEKE